MSDLNDLTQNVNIWNDEKSKSVTVTTDGAKERLDVDTGGVGSIAGAVDATNSTSTPLGISGVYTGTFTDVLNYAQVAVQLTSNVASATDGWKIEWSVDGTNVIDTDSFTFIAGTSKIVTFGCNTRYYRVKYTNGAIAQTTFTVSSIIKPMAMKPSSHRISDDVSSQDDGELVKAVLTGEDKEDSAFHNVAVTHEGALLVKSESPISGLFVSELLRNSTSIDMNVDGSSTPVLFTAGPPAGKKWFISRIIISITDTGMTWQKFGGILGALTNGVDLEYQSEGTTYDLLDGISIKQNSDWTGFCYDASLAEGPGTLDMFRVRWTFSKSGTFLVLKNDDSDVFTCTVNDDLEDLTEYKTLIQGYEVDE